MGKGLGIKKRVEVSQAVCQREPTLIRLGLLSAQLKFYPDCDTACFLAFGFIYGFKWPAPPPLVPSQAHNLNSMVGVVFWSKLLRKPMLVRCLALLP